MLKPNNSAELSVAFARVVCKVAATRDGLRPGFISLALMLCVIVSLAGCQGGDDTVGEIESNTASDGQAAMTFASTTAASGAYSPADITDVLLVTGQSNALGADTSYDAAIDTPVDRAFAYTSEGWQVADLNQVWDLNWHPRNDPATDPSNNFAFHFARKVTQRRPQRVVGFILVTAPGAPIAHWDGDGDFFLKITNRVSAALNELPTKSAVDGILWHQGETDWADDDYYGRKLNELIANFRSASWFGFDKPFICGETVQAPVNRRLMALNTDNDRWTGCVESDGLSTILDDLHFSAEGLRIIGTRYATKYLQMTE